MQEPTVCPVSESQGRWEISKAPTGISGFDALLRGGVPRGRTTLVVGGAGSGKTVLALQSLVTGARNGEPGIFVAFEEASHEIRANAASFGWDLPSLENDGMLFFLDMQLPIGAQRCGSFDLEGTLATLTAKAAAIGAKRIVFDSIDILLDLFPNRSAANQEVHRFRNWFLASGLTGLITSRYEVLGGQAAISHPFLLFLADCVVMMNCEVSERVAQRVIRVAKYRGSCYDQNECPFTIGAEGIEIFHIGHDGPPAPTERNKLSSGISRLDAMLGGGYFRGASILVTGSPGTAKTTLAGAFVQAACRRKERALYICFDEGPAEIVRNLESVNIHLGGFIDQGLLKIQGVPGGGGGAEEHLIRFKGMIEGFQPACMVVDPLSALLRGGGRLAALSAANRLLALAKSLGLTIMSTSLLNEMVGRAEEFSQIPVSTIADVWIHLTYVVQGGERNRALTIVKARGTGHSNQVRELILAEEGISLSDVYSARGEVLMGTLRAEREAEEEMEAERLKAEAIRRRRELETAEAEAAVRVQALNRELEARRADLLAMEREEALHRNLREARLARVRKMRRADAEPKAAPGSETEAEKR